jgi:hypothetical protein
MRLAIMVVAVFALCAPVVAAPPALYIDCDLNQAQLQPLREIRLQRGAPAQIIARPKVGAAWLDLVGVTGTVTARPSLTSTQSVVAAWAWTTNSTHQVAMTVATSATATACEWVYRLDLLHGGRTYAVGTGAWIVVERAIP